MLRDHVKGKKDDADMLRSENILAERPRSIGWKPVWDEDRFLRKIDNEIVDVLDLDKAKSSLIGSLFEVAKGLEVTRTEQVISHIVFS